jgi:hypothetical protein
MGWHRAAVLVRGRQCSHCCCFVCWRTDASPRVLRRQHVRRESAVAVPWWYHCKQTGECICICTLLLVQTVADVQL